MIELTLDTERGRFAAVRWGRRGGSPLLALHGWLDNAASFVPLAAALDAIGALDDIDLVAIDLAGHGHSAHRAPGNWYPLVDYGDDVDAVLDALDWANCDVLGHSLGGAIATAFAVAAPERINRLLLIEALGPLPWQPGTAAQALRDSRRDRRALASKQLRVFASIEQAIQARQQANGLSEAAARLLVERSIKPVTDGWVWQSDPRLTLTTALRASEAQIGEWIAAISQACLLIAADPPSDVLATGLLQWRLAQLRQYELHKLPGGHHLHMENPQPLATVIAEFLRQPKSSID